MNCLVHFWHGQSAVVTYLLVFIWNDPWWRSLLQLFYVAIICGKSKVCGSGKTRKTRGNFSLTLWPPCWCMVQTDSGKFQYSDDQFRLRCGIQPLTCHIRQESQLWALALSSYVTAVCRLTLLTDYIWVRPVSFCLSVQRLNHRDNLLICLTWRLTSTYLIRLLWRYFHECLDTLIHHGLRELQWVRVKRAKPFCCIDDSIL